jgi:hypothetical protein
MPTQVRVGSSGACPVLQLGLCPVPGTGQDNQPRRAVNSGHVTTLCRSGGGCCARLGRDAPSAAPPRRSPPGPSCRARPGYERCRSKRYVVTRTYPWRCPTAAMWPRSWPAQRHLPPGTGAVRRPGPGSSQCRGRSRMSPAGRRQPRHVADDIAEPGCALALGCSASIAAGTWSRPTASQPLRASSGVYWPRPQPRSSARTRGGSAWSPHDPAAR